MAIQTETKATTASSPGVLVLQWLTYAFWGWTVLALAWLTAVSVGFFVDKTTSGYGGAEDVAYPLAAVIVLFVISIVCDAFYSRREPDHKTGAATIIMIIHAVIFALFGIGSLIFSVFAVVQMLISTGANYGTKTALITGLTIALVYGATLLRVLRPLKLKHSALYYWVFMALVTATVIVIGIAGPLGHAYQTRDDRLLESGLPGVSDSIQTYTRAENALPKDLGDITGTLKGDARTIVDRNLVEYIPGELLPPQSSQEALAPEDKPLTSSDKVYAYKLCVTYQAEKGEGPVRAYPAIGIDNAGQTTPSTYLHAAGRVCYDLQTDYRYRY
jgi:hypothetical protein